MGFQYTTLNPAVREIRVLTVLPGGFDESLRVTIDTRSLDANPVYNALSYVWGDAASANIPGNVISIDGSDFPVTSNLLAALRYLRDVLGTADPITLWVDAVCINQRDLDERREQVSMMRDIYASAERVIIWLGEEDEESEIAFNTIPVLATRKHCPGDECDEDLLSMVRSCSSFFNGLPTRRPWFSRVWVIQELAMAKQDPLVVCGHKSTSWSIFMKAEEFVSRKVFTEIGMVHRKELSHDGQIPLGQIPIEEADDSPENENIEVTGKWKTGVLQDLYTIMRSEGGESLRRLLLISRSSQATDPRDRIYGLLGLLKADPPDPPNPDHLIEVDYRKSTAEVYTDAMAHIFAQGEGPYTLSGLSPPGISAAAPHITELPPTVPQPTLPSWVPDFSKQFGDNAPHTNGTIFWPPAGIGVSGPGADCNNGRRLGDKRTLHVEGLFVDTIEDVTVLGPSFESLPSQLIHIASLAEIAKRRPCVLEPSIRPYVELYKRKEPLWRVLVSNKRWNSGYDPAPDSYEAMYRKLLSGVVTKDESEEGEYVKSLKSDVGKSSFFTTTSGFVGICVPDSRKGDTVAILFGSPVPFVLRPRSDTIHINGGERPTYSLIGASYVSGIMSGEMVDELYCEDIMDSTTFFIR
ncbi:HET-domain-containing protein [Rostrohypoxylon terebratum]|nr:HET-domain-containing protein [Rostrohypoxylon terebratum]